MNLHAQFSIVPIKTEKWEVLCSCNMHLDLIRLCICKQGNLLLLKLYSTLH